MNTLNSRPKWWRLYLTFPLLVVLFALDGHLKVSSRAHQIVQIGAILLVYSLILLWLKANSVPLSQMDRKQYSKRIMIVSTAPLGLNKTDHKEQRILIHSDWEVNGMLSNTFEMGGADAELFSMNRAPQELDKE